MRGREKGSEMERGICERHMEIVTEKWQEWVWADRRESEKRERVSDAEPAWMSSLRE